MKLKPLSDRVVIKVIEAEEKTASGIVLPERPRKSPRKVKWRLVTVASSITAPAWKWMWLLVTAYFSPNMPERRLK